MTTYRDDRVCADCFSDPDLKLFVTQEACDVDECDFCGAPSVNLAELDKVAEFIGTRLATFYGRAVDQLPYESAEGGYQGWHVDTYQLLAEVIELDLPQDSDQRLLQALASSIGDDEWCDYDWLTLQYDQSLHGSWNQFCRIVKHDRRFFFHQFGQHSSHPDERSMEQFLSELCHLIDDLHLIQAKSEGYNLFRARGRNPGKLHESPKDLGPPPAERALVSNRMNPPGIPMFYGAENEQLACAEARSTLLSIGRFVVERPIQLLDLADLPPFPGFFSQASRDRLGLQFLHKFAKQIVQPISGDDRTNIDYIPTQIFTEFLRDYPFRNGNIDGLRYSSATGTVGANVVLFATQQNVFDTITDPDKAWQAQALDQTGERLAPRDH